MLDDFGEHYCGSKHYGPVLQEKGGKLVMRCSFCEKIFKLPENPEKSKKKKSSKTCIQVCDWISDDTTVRCKSCGYTGPLP